MPFPNDNPPLSPFPSIRPTVDAEVLVRLVAALERLAQPPDVTGIIREVFAGLKPLVLGEQREPVEPVNLFEAQSPLSPRYPLEPQPGDPAWELPEIIPPGEAEVAEREALEGQG